MSPVLEALAEAHEGKLRIAKINVDEEPKLAGQFCISSIATLVLFRAGEEVGRSIGTQRRQALEQLINQLLN